MCGENLLLGFHHLCSPGSPPRVRGKRSVRRAISGKQRITPACAGKTGILTRSLVRSQDHPRVCGENHGQPDEGIRGEGSPPRVRGKLRRGGLNGRCKDHPRVCGENRAKRKLRIRFLGSPPRVRGKLIYFREGQKQRGITPACAGKTSFVFLFRKSFKDHPRVCGENLLSPLPVLLSTGSPPRVRGKLMRIEL